MLVLPLAIILNCFPSSAADIDNSCDDTSALLQQPQRSLELQHAQGHLNCQDVLPQLSQDTSDLLNVCQEGLPATTCDNAIDALGAQPWSQDVVARVCEVWTEGKASQKIAKARLASLLSRTMRKGSRMDSEALDVALLGKGDDQPPVPANHTHGNLSNSTAVNSTKGANATTSEKANKTANATAPDKKAAADGKANKTANVTAPEKKAAADGKANKTANATAPDKKADAAGKKGDEKVVHVGATTSAPKKAA